MDDLKQDTTDTKHVPAEALRAAGLAEAPSFADWPKTPDGRLLCSPDHPMPVHIGVAHTYRWAHTNLHEVGPQRDGWPAGDIVTNKCDDCGIVVEAELPQ